jgi:uncharacterized membrane protein
MKKINKKVIKSIFIDILKGGFGVVVPTVGMIAVVYFIYNFILNLLSPLTYYLTKTLSFPVLLTDMIALVIVLFVCFICGIILKTSFGKFAYFLYESFLKKIKVFKIFNTLKEIYLQLTTDSSDAFQEFVIAHPFAHSTTGVPAFIVESYIKDDKEIFIVFAPTVPNPTSGFSYHLEGKYMDRYPNVPVDKAFRTILSCGAGTAKLLNNISIIESEELQNKKNNIENNYEL